MDGDQSDRRWKDSQRLERDRDNAPIRRWFNEKYGGRIRQFLGETTELPATETLEWRPCQYCEHGYRNNTSLERHVEDHHGPELRVQHAIRGRMSALTDDRTIPSRSR